MPTQSRQLAAIMFTDIVGYTALMGEDEQDAFELLKKNRLVQRPIIEEHNGRWLKEIGDGVLASFNAVSDAVYCAKAIQKACENEPDLKLRIGIHEGEVVFEGDDVFGDGVNIASRLEPLAPIGGIFVSESVNRNLGNKKGIETNFVREETLKNVKDPIKIYSVQVEGVEPLAVPELSEAPQQVLTKSINPRKMAFTVAGVLLILLLSYFLYSNFTIGNTQVETQSAVASLDKSIVVLPFADMSVNKDQEYFSDGMMEEILNHLSKIEDLKVISRTTAMQYKGTTKSMSEITEELGVSTALEGSVRKDGDQLRINVQLIEGHTETNLWSESYDRQLTDIFAVQSDVAQLIAEVLQAEVSPETQLRIESQPTTSTEAYNLYLRGRYFWNKRNPQALERSIKYFQDAIEKDSLYAMAYSGLADSFHQLGGWSYSKPSEVNPKGKEAALRALDLDNSLGQAHASLGTISLWFEWDWPAAEQHFKNAIALTPTYSQAYVWYFYFFSAMGDQENARIQIEKALELDPLSLAANFNYARYYLQQGNYSKALEQAFKTLEMDDSFAPIHWTLYDIYYAMEENDLAFKHFIQWRQTYGEASDILQAGYEESRWKGAAERMIPVLKTKSSYVAPSTMARYFIHLGDNEMALEYLEKGYNERDNQMSQIRIDPIWKALYSEPRFQELLRKIGLPPVSN